MMGKCFSHTDTREVQVWPGQERLREAPVCSVDRCLRGFAQSGSSHGHLVACERCQTRNLGFSRLKSKFLAAALGGSRFLLEILGIH